MAPRASSLPGKRPEGFATPKITGIEAVYAERLRNRIQTELAQAQSERSQVIRAARSRVTPTLTISRPQIIYAECTTVA